METLLQQLHSSPHRASGTSWVQYLHTRLRESYVSNKCPTAFLEKQQNRIDLSRFLCVTYGNVEGGVREAHFIMFHSWKHYKNLAYFHLQLQLHQTFDTSQITKTRAHTLHFLDPGNYQRSTFLIDMDGQEIYRLYELRYFLYLPHPTLLDGNMILAPLIPYDKKKQIYDRMVDTIITLLPSLEYATFEIQSLQQRLEDCTHP